MIIKNIKKLQELMHKNESRHSERSKALNAINELASTVDGGKEFQALTILKEKSAIGCLTGG